jgi:HK97 family phage prohead protease
MLHMKSTAFKLVKGEGDPELAEGEFTAYASTFTAKDSYGDVMARKSFDSSIAAWEAKTAQGHAMPVLYNHDTSNPHNNIGVVKSQRADDVGFLVRAALDLDTKTGAQVYRLIKGGRITQLSFAYDEIAAHPVKGDARFGDYNSVDDVLVHEVSITPYGANRSTEFTAVKAALDAAEITDPRVRREVGAYLLKQANALLGKNDTDANGTTEPPEKGHADNPPADMSTRAKNAIEAIRASTFTE